MKKAVVAIVGIAWAFVGLATEPPLGAKPSEMVRAMPSESVRAETPRVAEEMSPAEANDTIRRYCLRCHNDAMVEGGLTLESFDAARAGDWSETAEKMVRKLRAGMMPKLPARRPPRETLDALAASLEATLDAGAAPDPGRRSFQRLNRAEYAASIRELLGLQIDVGKFLPPDTVSASFDNIADVQTPSATLMEGYLRAASHVARLAIGDPDADPSSTSYRVPRTASQKERVEGAPFGTRGGVAVVHNVPVDGTYVFQVMLHSAPEGELFGRTAPDEQIDVSIDGERVALLTIDRWMSEGDPTGMTLETEPIYLRAGPRRLAAAFLLHDDGPEDDLITPIDHTLADTQIGLSYGVTTLPHLRDLTVVGPYEVTGVSETPARRRIFSCRPTSPDEETACAESIVAGLASRAYRRPLAANDLAGLMSFYRRGAEEHGFEAGVRTALQAMLASPHFVFRLEEVPADAPAGAPYRIGDLDLASRLAFFLWGAPPDDELRALAAAGRLGDPEVLRAQAERMLADRRSEALATRFAAQWLRLQDLDKVHPDALAYPYFDQTLAAAMRRETEMLFDTLVREDRSVLELLTADYTFANERLARHYGIPGVAGPEFRRVAYPDERRRGILSHASVLTLTSHANRTSPVLRGKWVMEVLLGSPPPPPPPDVPDLEETGEVADNRFLSVAEQLAEHRANIACRSCHNVIDPIGLSFENFDVTGAWRIRDRGVPVDPVGSLYDGTQLRGLADLREALLSRSDVVLTHFTESLMAYALGRRVEPFDMPSIRRIVRAAAEEGNRTSAFLLGVVTSPAFRMSRAAPSVETASGGQ